jgi:c-di-GMP-binding flagellar brake protein YcgR
LAYPVVGQSLQLEILDGDYAGRYTARVQDIEKSKFYIEMPLKSGAKVPTQLPQGLLLSVRYRAVDGAQCSFTTRVLGREVRQIPLLALHRPHLSEIHRQQRREFLRVPIPAQFDIVFMDSETKEIISAQAHGQDISGGGFAIRVVNNLGIRAGDIVGFRFTLPQEGGPEIVGKARVIRVSPTDEETGLKSVSLKYFEIREADRQRIVQYSFKRQIEMRDKGVLE